MFVVLSLEEITNTFKISSLDFTHYLLMPIFIINQTIFMASWWNFLQVVKKHINYKITILKKENICWSNCSFEAKLSNTGPLIYISSNHKSASSVMLRSSKGFDTFKRGGPKLPCILSCIKILLHIIYRNKMYATLHAS